MFRKILVMVTSHPSTDVAVRQGADLARAFGGELHLAHARRAYMVTVGDLPPVAAPAPEIYDTESIKLARELLAAATERAAQSGVKAQTHVLAAGESVDLVCQLALDLKADLVVVGTEGGNAVTRILTGSLVPGLITRSPAPVLACRKTCEPAATSPPPAAATT